MTKVQLAEMLEILYEHEIITDKEKTMFMERLYYKIDGGYLIDMDRQVVDFIDRFNKISVSRSLVDVVEKIGNKNKRIKYYVYHIAKQCVTVYIDDGKIETMPVERFIHEFLSKEIQNYIIKLNVLMII